MRRNDPLPLAPILEKYAVEFNLVSEGNQQVLCPAHYERTPSCSVNLSKQLWHCFSCGAGGSAIDLVMIREGLNFSDAKQLAEGLVDEAGGEVRAAPRQSGWAASSSRAERSRPYLPPWRRG